MGFGDVWGDAPSLPPRWPACTTRAQSLIPCMGALKRSNSPTPSLRPCWGGPGCVYTGRRTRRGGWQLRLQVCPHYVLTREMGLYLP